MKKLPIILASLVIVLSACNWQDSDSNQNQCKSHLNALMLDELLVSYYSNLKNDTIHGYDISLNSNVDSTFVSRLVDKSLSKEIEVFEPKLFPLDDYDAERKIMTIDEIKHSLGMVDSSERNNDASEAKRHKVIQNEYLTDEIKQIAFVEDWKLSIQPFVFSKTVRSYGLVREYRQHNSIRSSLLFNICVDSDTLANPIWEFIGTNISEVYVSAPQLSSIVNSDSPERENWNKGNSIFNDRNPFWNHYAYSKLVTSLLQLAKDGGFKIVDFETRDSLKYSDIESRMGVAEKVISYIDEDGNAVMQKIRYDMNPEEIKSLVFVEDWYLDTVSLAIKKEIKGIAPVRFYNSENDNELRKLIVFLADFK